MRIREDFTVFPRSLKSGVVVFYYQCYDEKGRRQNARSTGQTKKTEAKAFCMRLFKEGLLIPEQKAPTFAEFSNGWWDIETSGYLKWRQLHEPLAYSTIVMYKRHFNIHIKDYFAKYRLDEITADVVETWLLAMSGKKDMVIKDEKKKKTLNPKTINLVFGTFRLMIGEAVRRKIIKTNPCAYIKDLKEETFEREIFTVDEVRKLFPADWASVWKSYVNYMINRLAACTGMRVGELRGLRAGHVFNDYIHVCGQYTRYGYKNATKTKVNRKIPITPLIKQELDGLINANGNGYIFSEDGGDTPLSMDSIHAHFNSALKNIGIDGGERKARNLSFHAWRHFFNTVLRMNNVSDSKVQSVTGHRSIRMTDHYTHFDTREFTEVRNVQTELLAAPKEATA
jgi:integrase